MSGLDEHLRKALGVLADTMAERASQCASASQSASVSFHFVRHLRETSQKLTDAEIAIRHLLRE